MGFTAYGDVRGDCGHNHRTKEAAAACAARDHKGCQAQGGYSDRRVVIGSDGSKFNLDGEPLPRPGRPRKEPTATVRLKQSAIALIRAFAAEHGVSEVDAASALVERGARGD